MNAVPHHPWIHWALLRGPDTMLDSIFPASLRLSLFSQFLIYFFLCPSFLLLHLSCHGTRFSLEFSAFISLFFPLGTWTLLTLQLAPVSTAVHLPAIPQLSPLPKTFAQIVKELFSSCHVLNRTHHIPPSCPEPSFLLMIHNYLSYTIDIVGSS